MKIDLKFKIQNLKLDRHGQDGYIALFSTIILSAIFILLFVGMFNLSIGGMERISDKEDSEKATALASTCAEYALAQIRGNPDYAGSESHPTENCSIGEVTTDRDYRTFNTTGTFDDYTANMNIKVEVIENGGERKLEIVFWKIGD